ncbi:hypothetical protein CDL12_20582 [Handroanthus impetiginosus]|uniref:PWWP domain-containing protein n=1 Tax=Handroanthus impetiginosus TaxID=429701 RepID=A0A2G9GNS2_9LAMI|nr:hypothetical protein CDL12_20582 [Handroanthus impetiginosus]
MGSSGGDSSKGIDPSVGGLVWVRRRNGSWWPGRILGPDELPEGCLPTPRSGTPVKLLGREDASVDWYNLETSKRVKAFRCGEYDDCIEKAKASAPHLSKKTVKYARREDAILHALELESARLGKDCPDFPSIPDTRDEEQHHVDKSPFSSHSNEDREDNDEDLSSSEDDLDSAPELSQSGVSFEEPDRVHAIKEESKRWRTPNDSEDDGTEGVKRMRGLEDLGMGVASSVKRKRSQVAHVHEFLKRKNRRRTLTKVLECTAMVSIPVSEQLSSPTGSSVPGACESKVSGLESNESKINNSLVINNNSDSTGVSCENAVSLNASRLASDASLVSKSRENEISSMSGIPENGSSDRLFDVPLVAEEKQSAGLSNIAQKTQVGAGAQSSQSSHVETISLGNEEHNESGSTSSGAADVHNISQRMEKGASEWQLKGKRSRSRKTDMDDEAETNAAGVDRDSILASCSKTVDSNRVSGSLISGRGDHKSRPITEIPGGELRGWGWNTFPKETQRGSMAEMVVAQKLLPYRQSRFTVNPKYDSTDFSLSHHIVGSNLYDVTVEVKASYQPQHVPYISLMSKLYGRPIIGHPLTIKVLDDGSCNDFLSFPECYSSSSELDHKPKDMVYKRRPRGRPPSKHQPTKSQKSRRNGLLSKKIRKLSSLTGARRQSQEMKKPVVEKLKGPSIACVPLKVVFSRINAALNGSTRPMPRLALTGCI